MPRDQRPDKPGMTPAGFTAEGVPRFRVTGDPGHGIARLRTDSEILAAYDLAEQLCRDNNLTLDQVWPDRPPKPRRR
jgi:hypothetical protein